jgi:AcrR family transcriptional regulator
MTSFGAEEFDQRREEGRREASKRATRSAIRAAADSLIAAQGFEATSVHQIAEAAGITDRTFYRYFEGKEGLIADEVTEWMQRVRGAIVARPLAEPPAQAVRRGLLDVATHLSENSRSQVVWLFADQPRALKLMRRAGARPLLRLEALIVEALLERETAAPSDQIPDLFTAEVLARTAVAVVRSVAAERMRMAREGADLSSPGLLVVRGFEAVKSLYGSAGSEPDGG